MKRLIAAAIFLLSSPTHALDWQNSLQISRLFKDAGVEGTFVVYDVAAKRLVGHDQARAHTRFVPASTFKIPNTLIGLSLGAVGSVDELLPYGGKPQPFKAWERDMNLRDAISASSVPIYQELARRVGLERMQEQVVRINYGNQQIGTTVDNFWLVGPLRISAVEQTQFLALLAESALPFPQEVQKSASEIIRLEQRDGLALYGKSGWENAPKPGIGWWVGWVQKGSSVYPFALNIEIRQASDASKRVELGRASLKALGLL